MKCAKRVFVALCAAAALFLGAGFGDIQQTASDMAGTLHPVHYNVTYYDGSGSAVTAENVTVRFDGDKALLSDGNTVSRRFSEFTCLDAALLAQKNVCTAVLTLLLTCVAVVLTAAALVFSMRALNTAAAAYRRAAAPVQTTRGTHTRAVPAPVRRSAA